MQIPTSAIAQPNGSAYCYAANGNYLCSVRPHSGAAVSAMMNGNMLIITTSTGKTVVYEHNGSSFNYKSTR